MSQNATFYYEQKRQTIIPTTANKEKKENFSKCVYEAQKHLNASHKLPENDVYARTDYSRNVKMHLYHEDE